jgi:hypothetical protein
VKSTDGLKPVMYINHGRSTPGGKPVRPSDLAKWILALGWGLSWTNYPWGKKLWCSGIMDEVLLVEKLVQLSNPTRWLVTLILGLGITLKTHLLYSLLDMITTR